MATVFVGTANFGDVGTAVVVCCDGAPRSAAVAKLKIVILIIALQVFPRPWLLLQAHAMLKRNSATGYIRLASRWRLRFEQGQSEVSKYVFRHRKYTKYTIENIERISRYS
ncbi:MAG TPA: hypothetical protein VOA64_09015 [Candidatus Dormibacteraeota bacterium]|nr:hypothetical protein [Candidatus Dormibacteraeota bacterium]